MFVCLSSKRYTCSLCTEMNYVYIRQRYVLRRCGSPYHSSVVVDRFRISAYATVLTSKCDFTLFHSSIAEVSSLSCPIALLKALVWRISRGSSILWSHMHSFRFRMIPMRLRRSTRSDQREIQAAKQSLRALVSVLGIVFFYIFII